METLYGLSIRQPWLDMIVRGVKTMEIRGWTTKHRGIIALHAPWRIAFETAYFYGYESPWMLPRGKIVAVAEIADILELNSDSSQAFLEQHRLPLPVGDGAYGFLLSSVRLLEQPVACRGRLGLFQLPEKVAMHVLRFAHL
ncbi:MAG: hypothetical protein QOH25_2474 [Acidobacteriota bacterium]|jgi:hypothetical protein|nr:hypothetical protein [Acidobacteriota bacterium]